MGFVICSSTGRVPSRNCFLQGTRMETYTLKSEGERVTTRRNESVRHSGRVTIEVILSIDLMHQIESTQRKAKQQQIKHMI